MTVTWSQLSTADETITFGDLTITTTTKTFLATVSTGYLVRVDVNCKFTQDSVDAPIAVGSLTAVQHCTGTVPDSIAWGEEASADTTLGDSIMTDKTYIGTPLDGMGSPIGTSRLYRQQKIFTQSSNRLAGGSISLTFME